MTLCRLPSDALAFFGPQAELAADLEEKLLYYQGEHSTTSQQVMEQSGEISRLQGDIARLRTQLDHTASVSGDSQVELKNATALSAS